MKTEYRLNDTLNLRELIETVVDYIRTVSSVDTQLRTILSFLNMFFSGLNLVGGSVEMDINIAKSFFRKHLIYQS